MTYRNSGIHKPKQNYVVNFIFFLPFIVHIVTKDIILHMVMLVKYLYSKPMNVWSSGKL